jgi:hypothetical protein
VFSITETIMRRSSGLGIIGLLISALAQAGSGNGQITYFVPFVINGQEAFVFRLSTMSGAPACSSGNRFALTAADPRYKTIVAAIIGASLSGASIFAWGSGSCTTYAGSEDLSYICLGPDPC